MFFSYTDVGVGVKLFGLQHLASIFFFIILPVLVVWKRRECLRLWKHEKYLRISLGVFSLLLEFSLYLWHVIAGGITDWREIVPTTLCGLSIYLGAIALITRNYNLARVVYFYSFGAILSFIFVSIDHGIDRYRFYNYFINHALIIITPIYFRLMYRVGWDTEALKRAVVLLTPVLLLSFLINKPLQSNFFYFDHPIFEDFPVFTPAYHSSPLLYAALVFLSYYLLMGIMYLFALIHKNRISA